MRHPLRLPFFATLAVLAVMLTRHASADIPMLISYQGRVTDASGAPVPDNTYTMRFRIYDVATGGSSLWDSGPRSIALSGGVFSVLLGESPQPLLDLPFDEDYWLLVTFNGVDQTPRQRLASIGYAYMASGLVPGTVVEGSVNSVASGAITGVNTSTSGVRYGGYFVSLSPTGKGVYGEGPHTGVYGKATATTGLNYGGSFVSYSTDGRGVHAEAPHTGVYGWATATTGEHYGGSFLSSSPQGCGIYAQNTVGGWAGYFVGNVNINGDLTVSGRSFPEPDWDSGWRPGAVGTDSTYIHNLGGNPDDYLVDMQADIWSLDRTNAWVGEVADYGFYWHHLTNTSISVHKGSSLWPSEKFRIRIWRH